METTLHRQLKQHYAGDDGELEVRVEGYRVDVQRGEELIEIQLGSLSAIRTKLQRLLRRHPVRVVKPLAAAKWIVRRPGRHGAMRRRKSPKSEGWLDLVHELVYFVRVFPHPRLTLEVPLVHVDEHRKVDRRVRSWRHRRYCVVDQHLLQVHQVHVLRSSADLRCLVPGPLPDPFHTQHIAQLLDVDRWIAQRVAYCWRMAGTAHEVAKAGNTRLYRLAASAEARRRVKEA